MYVLKFVFVYCRLLEIIYMIWAHHDNEESGYVNQSTLSSALTDVSKSQASYIFFVKVWTCNSFEFSITSYSTHNLFFFFNYYF